jgi:hypothetical protein
MDDRTRTTIPAPPESPEAEAIHALFDELRHTLRRDPGRALATIAALERFVVDQVSARRREREERPTWYPPSAEGRPVRERISSRRRVAA